MVALGDTTAGLFSNNEKLADEILENGNKTEEKFWKMPINEEHRDAVKGESADLTNSAKTRYGGACSAAAFLVRNLDGFIFFSIRKLRMKYYFIFYNMFIF